MSTIDISKAPERHKWTLKLEGEETTAERNVRLCKEIALYLFALGIGITFVVIAVRIATDPAASADDRKWAFAAFTSIGSGVLGYLLKR